MTNFSKQTYPPPTNDADFEKALRQGLGRAVLWLVLGAVQHDQELILSACRQNWAFDKQTEDNRALYMADVIRATGEPEYYIPHILEALFADVEGDSYSQLFDLTALLAAEGNAAARTALYSAFAQHSTRDDFWCAKPLVDIDGLAGYLFVLQTWMREGLEDDDQSSEVNLLNEVEARFGADNVAVYLQTAAMNDPALEQYYVSLKTRQKKLSEDRSRRKPPPAANYENLRAMLARPNRSKAPMVWARRGRKMDDHTAAKLAADILHETDTTLLISLLCLFGEYEFPRDTSPLFAMARGEDEALASAAAFALSAVTDPRVRDMGLAMMEGSSEPWRGVKLLIHNYEPGDCVPMQRLLERLEDPDAVHWLGMFVRHVFDENSFPEFADLLTRLYEKGMCSMCRASVIDRLVQIRPLSDHILQELLYDAFEETRKAAD